MPGGSAGPSCWVSNPFLLNMPRVSHTEHWLIKYNQSSWPKLSVWIPGHCFITKGSWARNFVLQIVISKDGHSCSFCFTCSSRILLLNPQELESTTYPLEPEQVFVNTLIRSPQDSKWPLKLLEKCNGMFAVGGTQPRQIIEKSQHPPSTHPCWAPRNLFGGYVSESVTLKGDPSASKKIL